jgi:hypothetical protein
MWFEASAAKSGIVEAGSAFVVRAQRSKSYNFKVDLLLSGALLIRESL